MSRNASWPHRIFAVLSAFWLLAIVAFQAFISAFAAGMCHSGCEEARARVPLVWFISLAGIALAIWIIAMAFRGRLDRRWFVGLFLMDLVLPVLAYAYLQSV